MSISNLAILLWLLLAKARLTIFLKQSSHNIQNIAAGTYKGEAISSKEGLQGGSRGRDVKPIPTISKEDILSKIPNCFGKLFINVKVRLSLYLKEAVFSFKMIFLPVYSM